MLHDVLLKILEYKIPMTCTMLKLCNQCEENIQVRYLEIVLKDITRKWERTRLGNLHNEKKEFAHGRKLQEAQRNR